MEDKKIVGYEFNGNEFDSMEEMFMWLWKNDFSLEDIKEKVFPIYLVPLEIEAEDLIDDILDNLYYGDDIKEDVITSNAAVEEMQKMINVWIEKYGQSCVKAIDEKESFDFPIVDYIKWRYKEDMNMYGE